MHFHPTHRVHRVQELTGEMLAGWGIDALILDVDNTLTTHNNPNVAPEVSRWLEEMARRGVELIILSNNSGERVQSFAALLGLPCVARGNKPLIGGFRRCQRLLRATKERTAIVGDQLFTDILGGNRYGCKTILVDMLEAENTFFFRCKRALEQRLLGQHESVR